MPQRFTGKRQCTIATIYNKAVCSTFYINVIGCFNGRKKKKYKKKKKKEIVVVAFKWKNSEEEVRIRQSSTMQLKIKD